MSNNQAGKGSKPRPVNKDKFNQHFEQIDWSNSKNETAKEVVKKNHKTSYKY